MNNMVLIAARPWIGIATSRQPSRCRLIVGIETVSPGRRHAGMHEIPMLYCFAFYSCTYARNVMYLVLLLVLLLGCCRGILACSLIHMHNVHHTAV